ncbi:hypothetical protein D5F11_016245 [Siminovitchia terrae]|uniref:Uncharacterized protein n=1 Tax=Siminovitchia terrae TaxID=1914933 RepID=A0A429X5C9_SIMTE|nr:hypothetical protein [Siminovitchia terrae]RST58584.1 hypothetical protein D5F11_016245 [Siminovitchia terrae]
MIYPSFTLDKDMRVVQCPQCKNEEVEGNYCKICATYLFNICTGFHINDNNDDYYRQGLRWGQNNGGCDQMLEGNARFCHECGSTSSFFEDGLLDHWDENQNSNNEVAVTEDPFLDTNNNLDKSDDDLPF